MASIMRFDDVVARFRRSLLQFGLELCSVGKEIDDSYISQRVAKWGSNKPDIFVWSGNWFREEPSKNFFWFGFQGQKQAVVSLRESIVANFEFEPTNFIDFDLPNWSINTIPKEYKKLLCERDKYYHYIGLYENSLALDDDNELADKAAEIICNIIESIKSPCLIDIEELKKDRTIKDKTEYESLILARKGQGRFRRDLDAYWNGRCAVSGCGLSPLLRASHIKPWRAANNQDRLDCKNGLLLNAAFDALFDRGFIGFDDSGDILVSDEVDRGNIELFGLRGRKLAKPPPPEQREFLKYHRLTLGRNLRNQF